MVIADTNEDVKNITLQKQPPHEKVPYKLGVVILMATGGGPQILLDDLTETLLLSLTSVTE